jgi:hypothetical protein
MEEVITAIMPELVYDTDFSKSCEDSEPHDMN